MGSDDDVLREFLRPAIAQLDPDELRAVGDLASAQYELESLCDHDADWARVIERPRHAASASVLGIFIEELRCAGYLPSDDGLTEGARVLAGGTYIGWPPPLIHHPEDD